MFTLLSETCAYSSNNHHLTVPGHMLNKLTAVAHLDAFSAALMAPAQLTTDDNWPLGDGHGPGAWRVPFTMEQPPFWVPFKKNVPKGSRMQTTTSIEGSMRTHPLPSRYFQLFNGTQQTTALLVNILVITVHLITIC